MDTNTPPGTPGSPGTPGAPGAPGTPGNADAPPDMGSSKIQHTPQGFGAEETSVPVADATGPSAGTSKIRQLGYKGKRHEEKWTRTPNTTGDGAIHVRTFHSKLTDDALEYLDQSINEWLDAHPQYEVKFVSSSVGILTGKLKEPHLICQLWV